MVTETQTRNITYTQAINEAMREEMRIDQRVFIMGEDIQKGVYGASGGLFQEFGGERVRDCPLSENAFFGAAVGAAAVGMRPIVESLSSFMWVGMDQLVSQASKMRYMFGGQVNLPIVYRAAMYYGGSMAAHHSDRSHPLFMNIPGFKIVFASNAYDGKGLLKSAIRTDDPVIFWEDRTILGARAEVPEEEYTIPLGVADVKREGTDATIVAIGGMVPRALASRGCAGRRRASPPRSSTRARWYRWTRRPFSARWPRRADWWWWTWPTRPAARPARSLPSWPWRVSGTCRRRFNGWAPSTSTSPSARPWSRSAIPPTSPSPRLSARLCSRVPIDMDRQD